MRSEDEIRRHVADLGGLIAACRRCGCPRCVMEGINATCNRGILTWALGDDDPTDYAQAVADIGDQAARATAHHRN